MKYLDTKIFFLALFIMVPTTYLLQDKLNENYLHQIILFSIPLLWPGVAHGSLDVLIAKKNKLIKNKIDKVFFLLTYLFIPISFFSLWIILPNLIFLVFILLSILHFGISDSVTSVYKNIEILIRGLIVIILPFKFYFNDTKIIFSYFFIDEGFLDSIKIYIDFVYLILIILIASFIIVNLKQIRLNKKNLIHMIEIIGIFFCFCFFQPLISFFIYFCFLHSTRHLLEEKENLNLTNKTLIIKTLPMTFLTIIFFAFVFFIFKSDVNDYNLNYVIIGLSSLTVSHILLVNFTKS